MSGINSCQPQIEITNDTSGDGIIPDVVMVNDQNDKTAPDYPRPTTKPNEHPSARIVKGSKNKTPQAAAHIAAEKAACRAERRAIKLAKLAAFDKELARKSNEKYFTRGRDHLAAVKHQEECEAALDRVRARRRISLSTRRIVQEDVVNFEDERMALEALAPIQRPAGIYSNARYSHGDSDKENRSPYEDVEDVGDEGEWADAEFWGVGWW